jgi:hypothetical protein
VILVWLTAIVAGAIVLALAVYLALIALALTRAWRDVAAIAEALERTAGAAAPLAERVNRTNAAMRQLSERTAALERRLARAPAARRD